MTAQVPSTLLAATSLGARNQNIAMIDLHIPSCFKGKQWQLALKVRGYRCLSLQRQIAVNISFLSEQLPLFAFAHQTALTACFSSKQLYVLIIMIISA